MTALIGFMFFILNGLFSFIMFALIASMIASWLVFFNILNPYNPSIRQILTLLEQFTYPILEPFRRLIPPMGGFDLSFLVAVLVVRGIQYYLLPTAQSSLMQLVG
jgi:YggT family protein